MQILFTCITEVRNCFHVTQHEADNPGEALRQHIEDLPYDDGAGPFDEEAEWLQRICDGSEPIDLMPLEIAQAFGCGALVQVVIRNTVHM
jgi:hypothetical protein